MATLQRAWVVGLMNRLEGTAAKIQQEGQSVRALLPALCDAYRAVETTVSELPVRRFLNGGWLHGASDGDTTLEVKAELDALRQQTGTPASDALARIERIAPLRLCVVTWDAAPHAALFSNFVLSGPTGHGFFLEGKTTPLAAEFVIALDEQIAAKGHVWVVPSEGLSYPRGRAWPMFSLVEGQWASG